MMRFEMGSRRDEYMSIIPERIIPGHQKDLEKTVYGDAVYGKIRSGEPQWFGYDNARGVFLFQEVGHKNPMPVIIGVVPKKITFNKGVILHDCKLYCYSFASRNFQEYLKLLSRNDLWTETQQQGSKIPEFIFPLLSRLQGGFS